MTAKLLEYQYRLLEWPRTLILFLSLSPWIKRWRFARMVSHNRSVLEYQQRRGIAPSVAPLAAAQEIQTQEVVEEFNG